MSGPITNYEVGKILHDEYEVESSRYWGQDVTGDETSSAFKTSKLAQTFQHWLERNYEHRIIRPAITRAYRTFAEQYPEWASSFFDEHFLIHRLLPLVTHSGQGIILPEPVALARAWVGQLPGFNEQRKQELVAELTPAAADFLALLTAELHTRELVGKLSAQMA